MRSCSSWCGKVVSAVSLVALCFSIMAPAMWSMRCVGRDRVTLQWGQAKECQAPVKDTDKPALRMQCCSFASVKSNVEHFTWENPVPHAVLPVFIGEVWSVTVIAAPFSDEVVHYAHGPPLAYRSRSLLATGQLRV